MTEPIRILIADDHPLFREGVVHSLTGKSDLTIVGQASTGEQALKLTAEHLPDVLLLDIAMPGKGGIVTAQKISSEYPATKVIMLTASEDEDDLLKALKVGARGYIIKGVPARELVNAVRTVAGGGTYISPSLANSILLEFSLPSPPDPFGELTERERQILELVSEGLTNREIGERIHLAEKTIKYYMTNILQKLHVRSRVEAALLAQRRRLQNRSD